ncbi:unnamed protein product [Fructobacillus evanidus]|uniref:Uncharacterized protein n=1 Tax=Fructobacillus evanidus TaxID=3064281 RepID=A0ABN9Z104_9LACO|nr:unnamed protein product [Fructobacillus sp. LMG 32999]CAK1251500.1 unnamed protein product [Fructobacillus sp. LMG 32999]
MKDFDYTYQQVLQNLHILPSEFDEENYYRMAEIVSAQKKEDRPLSGNAFLRSIGIDPDAINESDQGKEV